MSSGPPTTIGRYRITREVARGDSAVVYAALDPQNQRQIALKVLYIRQGSADAAEIVQRFRREAGAALKLSGHPSVVTVYDVGQADRTLFIAMELIDGIGLDRRLTGALELALALKVTNAVAAALDAAHGIGIIHRDVKPSNVLLARDGRVLLTDFGLVGILSGQGLITKPGTVLGTPAYVAPELARGEPSGPASDQYALAVMTFEMLTGRQPFRGENAVGVLRAHTHDQPPAASAVRAGLPPAVDAVFARAFAKDPRGRFPSCAAFASACGQAFGAPATAPVAAPVSPVEGIIGKVRERIQAADLDGAQAALDAALRLAPDHALVKTADTELQQERKLLERYQVAQHHIQEQTWISAREVLNAIHAERPEYRDVPELRKQVFSQIVKTWEQNQKLSRPSKPRPTGGAGRAGGGAASGSGGGGDGWRSSGSASSGGGGAPAGQQGRAKAGRSHGSPGSATVEVSGESKEAALQELQDLTWRYEAAVNAAEAGDWRTALYIVDGIQRRIPGLLPSNRFVFFRLSQAATALERRAPKAPDVLQLLQRARAGLDAEERSSEERGTPLPSAYRRSRYIRNSLVGGPEEGSFELELYGTELRLKVRPPRASGKRVTTEDVEAALAEWPMASVDREAVARVVQDTRGEPVPVGEVRVGFRSESGPTDGLGIYLAEDELTAYLIPTGPAIQSAMSADDIRGMLEEMGITSGVLEHVIAEFAAETPRTLPAIVALGRPATEGLPPRIVPALEIGEGRTQTTVTSGTVLITVEQSDDGVPGLTVTSRETLPASGTPPDLSSYAGPGTKVADDGLSVVAVVRGTATFEGHRVSVANPDDEDDDDPAERDPRHKVVPGRPVIGPGRKWVEISALSAQIAKSRSGELLGLQIDELEAKELTSASTRWRGGDSSMRRTQKRYRVQARSTNGRFTVEAERDGLYLNVQPPEGNGRPVTTAQVMAELAHWSQVQISESDIREAVKNATGEPVRIGKATWMSVPCVGGFLGVAASDDGMVGYAIALGALRRGPLDAGAVLAGLAQAGLNHGVVRPEVMAFCQAEERLRPRPVAVGTQPAEPTDEPEYLFPRDGQPVPDVKPGTMLAWARTETTGNGRTVTGKAVSIKVQPRPLSDFIGEGSALEKRAGVPGNQAIVAAAAGQPTLIDGRITVMAHQYVTEPVRGPATFAGSVTLASAESGATVRARGDVTLESDAEDVVLEAGGSVRLQGVHGKGKARIQSGDNVMASWLRGCLVMARDTITISSMLAQSTIMAARRVVVRGEGTIRGGLVRATEEVVAEHVLAGDEGNPTRIVLGKLRRTRGERSTARLVVRGEIEPGVRISIDGATLDVTETIRGAVVRQRNGVIHIEPHAA